MLCTKCNQPLTNTHLIEGCKFNAKLRTSRHNNTFKLLQDQLEKHNGGRWPILSMDLGNKTIKDFETQTQMEIIIPQDDTTLQAIEATREGLQNDKIKVEHPTIIPTDLLPEHKRPQHHKLVIIRAVGYKSNSHGQLLEDTNFRGRRCIQLIECKYSTYNNTLNTITNIHNIYVPLKQAIMRHNIKKKLRVQIIPIIISITSNFHMRTLADIAQLVSFNENPRDALTYKSLPTQGKHKQ